MPESPIDPRDPRLLALLSSYERLTGESLGTPESLWEAPFALLSHGTQDPPVFWYGNQTALRLWERSFEEFTRMPSRETAEADAREVRERLLSQVREHGITRQYTGVRISKSGKRFLIENATVWNVTDDEGRLLGQAATFASWTHL